MGLAQRLEIKMMETAPLTPAGEADLASKKAVLEAAKAQKLAAQNTAPKGALHKALTDIKTTGQKALKFNMLKTLGISVTISSLLKQSQVFTSSIGSIFQLVGAMIDMFLAPLVKPLLIPFLRWMSRKMPEIAAAGVATADYLINKIFPAVQGIWESTPDWLRDNAKWVGLAVVANLMTGNVLGKLAIGLAKPIIMGIGLGIAAMVGAIGAIPLALTVAVGALILALSYDLIPSLGDLIGLGNKETKKGWDFFSKIFPGGSKGKGVIDLGGAGMLTSADEKEKRFLDEMFVIQQTGQAMSNLQRDFGLMDSSAGNLNNMVDPNNPYFGMLSDDMAQDPNGLYGGSNIPGMGDASFMNKVSDSLGAFMDKALKGFGKVLPGLGIVFRGVDNVIQDSIKNGLIDTVTSILPSGLDHWIRSVWDAFGPTSSRPSSGDYQSPAFQNPFGQGMVYQFNLTLDAGTLNKTGVSSHQIAGQDTGMGVAETITANSSSYLGIAGNESATVSLEDLG